MNAAFSHYLDVVAVLAKKDFKLRYRNSVLGFVWSLLNPLAYMLILTIIFSVLLHSSVPNYGAWILMALLVWRFFQVATSQSLSCILSNPSLVTKVYMPRALIVLSSNFANLIGSTLEFVVLLPLILLLGVPLDIHILFLPVILVIEFVLVFSISLSLASLNVKYRDFSQIWEIALQLGFFVSPIVYDESLVPSNYQFLYSLNPITRLIQATRGLFLKHQLPLPSDLLVVLSITALFFVGGLVVFSILQVRFAEEL
ncbi:MAG: ABC transporter permease [Candidatus Bathyarchaeia archaeon]